MNRTLPLLPALALGVLLGLPASGQATCYRVTSVGSETTTSEHQIRPGEGTAGSWTGACDTCNGSLGLPSVVSVSDEFPALSDAHRQRGGAADPVRRHRRLRPESGVLPL